MSKSKASQSYQTRKERARQIAIDWQRDFAETSYSWEGLARAGDYFEKLGRRYGLIREFRENGII